MRTHYGIDFDSAIGYGNIYGVQFHPEKSHRFGMQILKNFAEL
jgi:glutamine amidotransferase